jgi:pantoate--beta-alanine ligase
MEVIASPRAMQRRADQWRKQGRTLVLVPTMGALHEGHLSLLREARRHGDRVVMSIYVNPTQFGPREDFSRYPRPWARDRRLAQAAGADCVFRPVSLYAPDASTSVLEKACSAGRCGAFRPGHFEGVATVVLKLFNLVKPHAAVFGQKDAQQCEVIERMVRDLCLDVEIFRAPIVRDANGVALSSRNAYLSPEEYARAVRFARILKEASARGRAAAGAARRLLAREAGIHLQYAEVANGFLCAAVKIGETRLIDNRKVRANTA